MRPLAEISNNKSRITSSSEGVFSKNLDNSRMEWLQALRALAAMAVLFFHCKDAFVGYPIIQKILGQGFFGVDIFFCLSGYIMCLSCYRKQPGVRNGLQFLITRGVRIYSGYYPALLLTLAAAAIGLRPVEGNWLASLFLTSTRFDEQFLETAWTLVYELRFYAAIGLVYFFLKIQPSIRNITLLATIIALYNLGYYAFALDTIIGGIWPLRSTLNGFFLEFMFGMYLFMLNKKYPLQLETCLFLAPVSILLLAAGSFNSLFANFELLRAATYGLASACILAIFVALENKPDRRPYSLLVKIGDASYSLYLIHPILLTVLFFIWHRFIPAPYFHLLLPLGLIAIVFISWIWFHTFEKPIFQLITSCIRSFFDKKETTPA